MTKITHTRMTFEEYLQYDDGTDKRYEFVDGKLVEMLPPDLIIEVVSPGTTNEQRDYRYKRSEYAARGVPEYWVINPISSNITVYTLVAGFYEEVVYTREAVIQSSIEVLRLTATQILNRQRNRKG